MKIAIKILSLFLIGLQLAHADNGIVSQEKITVLSINKGIGNKVLIRTSGSKERNPSCHQAGSWSFVLPLESELDKAVLSLLLTAKASQSLVTLEGAGQCDVHSTIETLHYVTSY